MYGHVRSMPHLQFSPETSQQQLCRLSSPVLPKQVDVWAVGVMLYQMLFGRRPFGEGCSQEEILRDEVMLKARQVTFQAKPAISAECKDFITRCANKARRPWC